MFTEKVAALSEALVVATTATLGGSNGAHTAKRVSERLPQQSAFEPTQALQIGGGHRAALRSHPLE